MNLICGRDDKYYNVICCSYLLRRDDDVDDRKVVMGDPGKDIRDGCLCSVRVTIISGFNPLKYATDSSYYEVTLSRLKVVVCTKIEL